MKARGVCQNIFDSAQASSTAHDSAFSYYAHTAAMSTTRLMIMRPNRRKDEVLCLVDVATAFLNSEKYSDGDPEVYLRLRHPWLKN